MASDDSKIQLGNASGDVELITSYKIQAQDASGKWIDVGTAVQINPSERRGMTYNFVIGNNPPDEARDVIPGTITDSTLSLNYVALYKLGVIKAFGQSAGYSTLTSLRHQTKPFKVQAIVTNPADGTAEVTTYSGCFFSDYRATKDISRGDIRIMEDVTIHFKTLNTTVQ